MAIFNKESLESLRQKVNLVEVLSSYVEFKRTGASYKGLCPFHDEKTPSFMVSPELGIFKCFGCDAKGDVFSFLEQFEGMEFPEALKYLADRAGVKLVKSTSALQVKRKNLSR